MRPTDALLHPGEWGTTTVGKSVEVKRGVSWSKDQEHAQSRDDRVPVIRIGNVQGRLELDDLLYLSGLKPAVVRMKRVTAGWTVIVGSNGNRARVGNAVLVRNDAEFLFASFLIGAKPKAASELSPEYFYRWLSTERVQGYLSASSEGTTGLSNLSHSFFKAMAIPVPPPDEQAAIARILDAIDTALGSTRAAVDATASLRDALIQALLDRGIGEDGRVRCSKAAPEGFVATQLGLVPREWSVEPLSAVADIERGRFSPRPRNDPRYYKGPYPFIQTGQVSQAKGRVITTFTQTLNSAGKAVSREFPTGTVMVTIAANIGETAILGLPMCAPDSLVGVVAKGANVPRYIELCLRRLRRKLLARAPRSAQANINLTFLKPLRIPVPTPREQLQIARVIDAADARVQAIEARVEALRALRGSLVHDLLAGRVRVTNEIKAATS